MISFLKYINQNFLIVTGKSSFNPKAIYVPFLIALILIAMYYYSENKKKK